MKKKIATTALFLTCDVSQGPNGLLADVWVRWGHQADEGRDGPSLHHSGRLVRGARGDVGQGPRRLKLDGRALGQAQEDDKLGDEASVNDAVDWGVPLPGQ